MTATQVQLSGSQCLGRRQWSSVQQGTHTPFEQRSPVGHSATLQVTVPPQPLSAVPLHCPAHACAAVLGVQQLPP
jgi:hypothetical protein